MEISGIKLLPPTVELETKEVLKKLISAKSALAELKGVAATIPNESILVNTLTLQEAKESSAIENIITTHDDIFQSDIFTQQFKSAAAKEVHSYANALRKGFELVRKNGIITNNHIIEIQHEIEGNNAGFRKLPGTNLINDLTGEVVYIPPQDYNSIVTLMDNLEQFINDNSVLDVDPLIKMAIIHHQFESIHPFYDGNGRTGRIINILYLIQNGLLNLPVLYLSRYIIKNKSEYYRLLQEVRLKNTWTTWVLFMLNGVEETSYQTIELINEIKILMMQYKHKLRKELPKIYSQDLINNLFRHPYTKIEFIMNELRISRLTATKYLDKLVEIQLVNKQKIGRDNFYINAPLFNLLSKGNT